jgi:S1-C subfamily serine protease
LLELLDPALATAPRPDREELSYDLDPAFTAIVRLHADVDEHCATASTLGPEREGAGIVIDENGLILTVGYIIVEARNVTISILGRTEAVVGEAIAYDHESGLGMARAVDDQNLAPMALGSARTLVAGDPVVVSGYGGYSQAIAANVVARQEFAGSWEYMLDNAVFTTPLHPYWGGAALIGPDGALAGVGSLYLEEPLGEDGDSRPGNMFVPIDNLPDMYRALWAAGEAGAEVRYTVLREDDVVTLRVTSGDRYAFLDLPQRH